MERGTRGAAAAGIWLAVLAWGCTAEEGRSEMDSVAESYVRLVLELGVHAEDYVDAYHGPEAWRREAAQAPRSLVEIRREALNLRRGLPAASGGPEELRRAFLAAQLRAVAAYAGMLDGTALSFDEESEALYDAVAPRRPESYYDGLLAELDGSLPGAGDLRERYAEFRSAYVIPTERLDALFLAAIEECRRRTAVHLELPPEESFSVEYVRDRPWSAYNWYQGNYRSRIEVNTDLPVHVDRAIDLACHEGYPGHHVYNVLLERDLLERRGWIEFCVYPLFSPQSLIAEGSAEQGISVAFPGDERLDFEREVLYPLAGLDPAGAARYAEVQRLIEGLGYSDNDVARDFLEGRIDRPEARARLERYGLRSADRSAQRLRFIERYRSYVINYNLGRDLVAEALPTEDGPEEVWQAFGELLSSPRTASSLD